MTPIENDSFLDFDLSPNQARLGHSEVVAPSLVAPTLMPSFSFPSPFGLPSSQLYK